MHGSRVHFGTVMLLATAIVALAHVADRDLRRAADPRGDRAPLRVEQSPSAFALFAPVALRSARLGVLPVRTAPLPSATATATPHSPSPSPSGSPGLPSPSPTPPTGSATATTWSTGPCDTPTPPRPTPTPLPTPTGTPIWGEYPEPAILAIDGVEHEVPFGTFCWPRSFCVDCIGVPTQLEPLRLRSPFVGHLRLPPAWPPSTLTLRIHAVKPGEEVLVTSTERWWDVGYDEPVMKLDLAREQSIQIAREPGWYVLDLWVAWQDLRADVNYGYLVEVVP